MSFIAPCSTGKRVCYRVNEVTAVTGISRSSLYGLMRRGKLKFVTVGAIRMITDQALHELLKIEETAA